MSEIITVGICSIGSGVGQSVIDSCHLSRLPLRTIGLGNNPLAFGLYECDDHALLPSYYDASYVEALLALCETKKIDVLIPGHDDEALLLARNTDRFHDYGVAVIVAAPELISICRAKETMAESFPEVADLFVRSYTLDDARSLAAAGQAIYPLFAKPRGGYASKGISIINGPEDLEIVDDGVIIQEVAIPHADDPFHTSYVRNLTNGRNLQAAEISVQLLADKEGRISAQCATYNKLNNGIPIEILPYKNAQVNAAVSSLTPYLQKQGLRGPLNIQGRLTDQGFKIFELNPRFTGITGLRAIMGFNEVAACIRHWGLQQPLPSMNLNSRVFGIRQTTNKAVQLSRNERVGQLYQDVHIRGERADTKPVILVTGSTGAIGRELVGALGRDDEFEVWTLDRSKQQANACHQKVSATYDWHDLDTGLLNLGAVDKLVHLASARPFHGPGEISDSLAKGMQLFSYFAEHGSGEIIFASSQSVYGSQPGIPWTEDLLPQPESIYAAQKYALEQHLANLGKIRRGLSVVVLRVGAVTGNDPAIRDREALARMTCEAMNSRQIEILGGQQILGRVDYRDVADGIAMVIKQNLYNSHAVFNLGMENSYTLDAIAECIAKVVERERPGKPVQVTRIPPADTAPKSHAVDASKFIKAYAWKPKYSLENIIESLVQQ